MFSKKIILTATFALVAAFFASAQKRVADDWSITDYFKNLPEKYKTFSGDFLPPSTETTVIDDPNGYAAYLNSPSNNNSDNPPFPIFETALFKSGTKTPLLVVSNLKSDPVCEEHETFFLRRVGESWREVENQVLPAISLKMFWDDPQSAAMFKKIVEQDNSTTFHFELPRNGTRMKVSLEICDHFLEVTPLKSVDELRKLIGSTKPIYLDWDNQKGKFVRAK